MTTKNCTRTTLDNICFFNFKWNEYYVNYMQCWWRTKGGNQKLMLVGHHHHHHGKKRFRGMIIWVPEIDKIVSDYMQKNGNTCLVICMYCPALLQLPYPFSFFFFRNKYIDSSQLSTNYELFSSTIITRNNKNNNNNILPVIIIW